MKKFLCIFLALMLPTVAALAQERRDTLESATVTGSIDRDINFTQTGLTKIDGSALNRGFAVFSAPDVLKTLQMLPGVASGTELLSNLYVHGGDGTDNLFLLDGVPLYQICHLGGIFSSFNTDFIDKLDFYKSGFPARYGGRTSSVVDIRGKDGSFDSYEGSWSLGLLEGRFQLDGPIVKGKTSFNLALRRSWADLIMYPVCAVVNKKNAEYYTEGNEHKTTIGYSFTDFNARITHKFSDRSILAANVFVGNDQFTLKIRDIYTISGGNYSSSGNEVTKCPLSWGNVLASVNWDKKFSDALDMRLCAYWAGTRNKIRYDTEYESEGRDSDTGRNDTYYWMSSLNNRGILDDAGVTADLNWRVAPGHQLRAGLDAIVHSYRPVYGCDEVEVDNAVTLTDSHLRDSVMFTSPEISIYAEDEMSLTGWLTANIGLRNTVYCTRGKTWNSLEPRAALKFQCTQNMNVKVSYSEMSQFSHQLATSYLDLPTNCWMPSTSKVPPMRSRQVAGGLYWRLPYDLHLNLEGWFKTMDNLIEYCGENALFPKLSGWDETFNVGKGRSYGMELDFGYETPKVSANLFYTLSWNQRYFERLWPEWYRDRNDNRHKITVMVNWRPTRKMELYAAWNYHSGNRMTVATQYIQGAYASDGLNGTDMYGEPVYRFYEQYIYEAPNNIKLPDYHRLDIGMNIHKKTKRGGESLWNVSIYNVYCRMNPLFAYVELEGDRGWDPSYKPEKVKFKGVGFGIVPIVPTFSYTRRFGGHGK